MAQNTLKIAVGQLASSSSLARNAVVIKKIINRAVSLRARVLFLPEASDYLSLTAKHSISLAQRTDEVFLQPIQDELRRIYALDTAASDDEKGLYVAIGVHQPTSDGKQDRVRNNHVWLSNKGDILHTYQKLHLFNVTIKDGPILRESDSVEPGNDIPVPFPVSSSSYANFKVGLSICYDIRFSEVNLRLRKLGANILTYPSAFTTTTGEAHWVELNRARAIDSQAYVILAAQNGPHDVYLDDPSARPSDPEKVKKRVSYGRSIVVDPWGKVLAEAKKYDDDLSTDIDADGDYYEVVTADLDLSYVDQVRGSLPVFEHRRPEVFGYEV